MNKKTSILAVLVALLLPSLSFAAIAPKNLKAVDNPSDEECLTFESDYNAFEWVNCHATTFTTDVTLENSEFIDNGTDGTINLGRNDSGTVTLGSLDNDSTAALTINPGGVTTLTLGGSTDTVSVAATTGVTLSNNESVSNGTNGAITLGRNDSGTVTLTAADDDATAALTVVPGGAAALTLGGASTTSITSTTDDTGDAEEVAVVNGIGPADVSIHTENLIFCGQNDENGTIYFGPATTQFNGDNSASIALASAACDALDNATEATADEAISTLAVKAMGMRCKLNGTLGASETVTFTLRTATGDVVTTDGSASTLTCALAAGETECRTNAGTTTNIAAGATLAMKVVQSSNNTDDDGWCSVTVAFP